MGRAGLWGVGLDPPDPGPMGGKIGVVLLIVGLAEVLYALYLMTRELRKA
ncbi:hypothetical protein ABIA38_006896 [Embleya sp. AB8]